MPSYSVKYSDGSNARNVKVSISVNGGGMVEGFTDNRGNVSLSTSGSYGKIYVSGKEVWSGSLNISSITA